MQSGGRTLECRALVVLWEEGHKQEMHTSLCPSQGIVCVLTCPPEVRVVSNTKAYQSPLDVPPPPRNLTTRIKAKPRGTLLNPVVSHPPDSSPIESARQCRALVLESKA